MGRGNGRLARRALWRRRKLWVHKRENKAAISIQCAIRVYLARKNVQRQVHAAPPPPPVPCGTCFCRPKQVSGPSGAFSTCGLMTGVEN
jgi:hypothetical protein